MIKTSKKWIVALASFSILACSARVYNTNANDIIYNDSNVSITSALDRYIASNADAYKIDETATVSDAEQDVDKEAVKGVVTGSISEVQTSESTLNDPDFVGKALVVIADNVNIRAEADVNSDRVGIISSGGIMDVQEKGEEWSLISSGNCTGYIKNEFIAFGDDAAAYAAANLDKVAVINASSLRLRAAESEDSECLTLLPEGERYHILSQGNEWTKVEVDATLSGYVKNEFIYLSYATVTAMTVAEEDANSNQDQSQDDSDNSDSNNTDDGTNSESPEPADTQEPTTEAPADVPVSGVGTDVANYALQFVGNPYVYGGTSLTNGADCSGFAMKIYENFGYSIPRTADVQANAGVEVSLTALAPGDLVFYDHGSGSIQHVGIYIGNGQIVHASNSRTGIIVSNAYYSTPCKAARIIY